MSLACVVDAYASLMSTGGVVHIVGPKQTAPFSLIKTILLSKVLSLSLRDYGNKVYIISC